MPLLDKIKVGMELEHNPKATWLLLPYHIPPEQSIVGILSLPL